MTTPLTPSFDERRLHKYSHGYDGFDHVLHIAHFEWHGIRQCAAYAPGQKLLIPAESPYGATEDETQTALDGVSAEIERRNITHVIFQGYSENADKLLIHLKSKLGPDLKCFCVNHVTPVQFDNYFEMEMIERLLLRKRFGLLNGVASVKSNFSELFDGYWNGLIVNFSPNIPDGGFSGKPESRDIYVPLDPGWRKNMYTNYLAAMRVNGVERVLAGNYPFGLEGMANLENLLMVGYLRGDALFSKMADSAMLLTATLAECQPMTQLEAFAVGTPALTGPLNLSDFDKDPLMELCTTRNLDDAYLLASDTQRLFDAATGDPAGMRGMIAAHLRSRNDLAASRYAEFLGLS